MTARGLPEYRSDSPDRPEAWERLDLAIACGIGIATVTLYRALTSHFGSIWTDPTATPPPGPPGMTAGPPVDSLRPEGS
jgi:hypothetical protein